MNKIILKKEKKFIRIVVVNKHKIMDIIGFKNDKGELQVDLKVLIKYLKKGTKFSTSAFNLIYKFISKLILKTPTINY